MDRLKNIIWFMMYLVLNLAQGQEICNHGDVRFADNVSEFEGRVEICDQGMWLSVCESSFQASRSAGAICNQLGIRAVSTASSRVPVMDDFVLNITCPSGLSSIRDCNLTRITNAACSEANQANGDAEVAYLACGGNCTFGQIRLVGGTSEANGRVEICSIFLSQVWGGVCDRGWDNRDAQVVCRQLGFATDEGQFREPGPTATTGFPRFGPGGGNVVSTYENAQCTGSESRLIDCQHSASVTIPGVCNYAGVVCSESSLSSTPDRETMPVVPTASTSPSTSTVDNTDSVSETTDAANPVPTSDNTATFTSTQNTRTESDRENTSNVSVLAVILASFGGAISFLLIIMLIVTVVFIVVKKLKNRKKDENRSTNLNHEYSYVDVPAPSQQVPSAVHETHNVIQTSHNIAYQAANISNTICTRNLAYGVMGNEYDSIEYYT